MAFDYELIFCCIDVGRVQRGTGIYFFEVEKVLIIFV